MCSELGAEFLFGCGKVATAHVTEGIFLRTCCEDSDGEQSGDAADHRFAIFRVKVSVRVMPEPSLTTTRRFACTLAIFSSAPWGQRISRPADVSVPRPKCRRRSFTERYEDCANTA